MAKPEWGAKHLCENCGAKFYDMLRDPVTCPKCDTKVSVSSRPRRGRAVPPKPEVVARPPVVADDEALAVDDDDILDSDDDDDVDDDALLEDEDEYGSDDIPVVGGIGDDEKDA